MFGQGDAQDAAFVTFDGDRHAVLQIGRLITQLIGIYFHLLIAFRIHEGIAVAVTKQELILPLIQADFLDVFRGAEAFVQFAAVAQIAQLDLQVGPALARLSVGDFHRPPQSALVLDHIAGPNGVAIDPHGVVLIICPF